jgi:tetratricopeptide (TPR) repeat protein
MRSMKSLIKNITSLICLASLSLTLSAGAQAALQVKLAEPDWQFLLFSQPVNPSSAQLESNERSFAQQIQPLLNAQNYQEVAKAFSNRELNQDSAALQQLRGQVMLSLKRYDEAELALKSALKKSPNLALAHRSLSMLYMLKKDYTQARIHLTRSIELGVADAQLFGQLAFVNLNSQHAASAIAGYQQALYLEPENSQWQQGLLYAWLNSHNFAAAQRLVEDMLEQGKHDNPTELWLLRSQIAMQQQQPQIALSSLEIALQLAPQDTSNTLLAAKLHVQHGSVARAVELLGDSLPTVTESELPEVMAALDQILPWLLSQSAADKNQQRHAAALLEASSSLKIKGLYQAKLNLYRGQLALQQNHTDNAKRYLMQAIEQEPLLGDALLALAKVYQKLNLSQQAELYFVRASAIPQVKLQALLANAQLQIEQSNYPQALELLQQAVRVEPNRRDLQHNVRELQKIVRQSQYAS